MHRSIWKGNLRFSLVSVPVEAYTATETGNGEIRLNQLHDACHSRIRYKKTCPIHGEVSKDEIVTGYQYAKDKYVIVDRNEIEKAQADRSIHVHTFVASDAIDPLFYAGQTYYLAPGKGGERPYAVLRQAMEKSGRYGVATVVLHGREQLMLVRPIEHVLAMTVLHYESEMRKPDTLGSGISPAKVNAQELKLAQQLIEASTDKDFDFGQFEDHHTEQLRSIIDAKVAGKEVVAPEQDEEDVPIINLVDALKKSMQRTKGATKSTSKKASRHIPRRQRRKSS